MCYWATRQKKLNVSASLLALYIMVSSSHRPWRELEQEELDL